jgi:hypothetical protein
MAWILQLFFWQLLSGSLGLLLITSVLRSGT